MKFINYNNIEIDGMGYRNGTFVIQYILFYFIAMLAVAF